MLCERLACTDRCYSRLLVLALSDLLCRFSFIVINGVLTFGVGTHMSQTCDASVVLCVSVVSDLHPFGRQSHHASPEI